MDEQLSFLKELKSKEYDCLGIWATEEEIKEYFRIGGCDEEDK